MNLREGDLEIYENFTFRSRGEIEEVNEKEELEEVVEELIEKMKNEEESTSLKPEEKNEEAKNIQR